MQEVFEKIIKKLENKTETAKRIMVPEIHDELDRIANETAESFIEAYKEAIEIVEHVVAEYVTDTNVGNNGWISADEPPKDDNYVLLSFENFDLPLVGRYEADGEGTGAYYIGDCDGTDTCIANDLFVNAWQPLPHRYNPDEQKKEKKTKYDQIRSMSDEELAEIIMCPYDTAGKPADIMPCVKDGNIQEFVSPEYCKKCMMDWLHSEVEE